MLRESTSVVLRSDLTAVAQEYAVEKALARFIGRRAAPIFEAGQFTGNFPIMNRENFKKRTPTNRAPDGSFNRITGEFGNGTFSTEDHGLEYPIDRERRARYARFIDAEAAATQILYSQIMLDHEFRVATLYSDAGFSNTNVTTAWSTTASAVPLDDLATGIEALADNCGAGGDDISLIIPRADFRELLRVAQVVDKGKYTYPGLQPSLYSPMQVAAMLGIKEVLIASSAYDTTEEGVAESVSQIWTAGVMYLAVLAKEGDPLEIPSAARTILWTDRAPEFPVIESYEEPKIDADIVRVRENTDEILIGAEPDLFTYQLTNT